MPVAPEKRLGISKSSIPNCFRKGFGSVAVDQELGEIQKQVGALNAGK